MDDYLSEASEYALDLSLNYGDHVLQNSTEINGATAAEAPGFGVAVSLVALGGAAYLALKRDVDTGTEDEKGLAETVNEELEE